MAVNLSIMHSLDKSICHHEAYEDNEINPFKILTRFMTNNRQLIITLSRIKRNPDV